MDKYELLVGAMLEHINELNSHQYIGNYNVTEELADLREAIKLANLTEKQREVIRLVYFEDMRQGDASGVLGIKQSALSLHAGAAKKKIAQVYKQWEALEDV